MINTNNKIMISPLGVVIHPYKKFRNKELEYKTSIRLPNHSVKEVTGFYLKEEDAFVTYKWSKTQLQKFFPDHIIEYIDPVPSHYIGNDLIASNIELTAEQNNIVEQCKQLQHNRVYLCLPTGFGKTVIAIYITVAVEKTKSLVICPSKTILDQWQEKYSSMGNIPKEKVLHLTSSKQIDDIMSGKKDMSEKYVFVCTQALLTSFANTRGWFELAEFAKILGIGIVFVDEAHKSVGGTIKILGFMPVRKVYYLSADFNQAQKQMKTRFAYAFQGVPIIQPSETELAELRHIVCNLITFNSKPNQRELGDLYSKFGFNMQHYAHYQLNKGIIFDVLVRILKLVFSSLKPGRKIIVLTTTIKAVDEYTERLKNVFYDKKIKRFHSKLDDEERHEIYEDDVEIIVSTYMSLGFGLDLKGVQHVMSLDLVNEIWDNQAAGRARPIPNEPCFYYIFADYGLSKTRDTLNSRINYMMRANVGLVRQFDYQ